MKRPKWTTQATLLLGAERKGSRLSVVLTQGPGAWWLLLALESSAQEGDLQGILNMHGHQSLPSQASVTKAIALAERYAAAWIKDPKKALALCGCKDIERPTKAKR